KVDIRLLATSNRDLQEEVRKGNFRDDLFFRLNVMALELPALRHRPADIPVLAEHFAKKYAEANGVKIASIAPEVMDMLRAHDWRGNVRELENTMHRAVLLAQDSAIGPEAILLTGGRGIPVSALQHPATTPAAPAAKAVSGVTSALVGRTVAAVERDLIIDTLQHCLGNRTHAANILGISIRTLRNKLKQYSEEGVPVPGAHSEGDHFSAA
ncbi:MAG: helix-turn-helix domain-containing protein, partial [Dongiaceae bacterium]